MTNVFACMRHLEFKRTVGRKSILCININRSYWWMTSCFEPFKLGSGNLCCYKLQVGYYSCCPGPEAVVVFETKYFSSDSESKVQFHLQTHVDGVLFFCNRCSFTASTARVLGRHKKTHETHVTNTAKPAVSESSGVNSISMEDLPSSPQSSNSSEMLEDPLEIHRDSYTTEPKVSRNKDPKRYKCLYCPFSKNFRYEVKRHERIHTGEKPYSCNYCDYTSSTSSALTVHRKRHLVNVAIKNLKSTRVTSNNATNVNTKNKLKETDIEIPKTATPIVQKKVITVIPHPVKKPPISKPLVIKPTNTAAIFRKEKVKSKKIMESNEEVFRCGYCQFQHISKQQVLRHMPIHTDYKPKACNLCNYRTHCQDSLKLHMQSHENDIKPVMESNFDFCITQVISLAKEEETTDNAIPVPVKCKRKPMPRFDDSDKPYKCTFCPHRSKRGHDMFRHEKIHTG
ncbi:unnamed protein product [Allacma fusca]|uniref:C2H2-type domain-containing protein n=1 Tax=Allacma fusca TaxID=39272 RepID=A0A8J2L931_9HEXA|nr:unnamed protein product [Allacma fusca]